MSKLDQKIRAAVAAELERRRSELPEQKTPPAGYNATEVIRGALFKWVLVPFNGVMVWCQLRTLNATQLEACGAVSMLDCLKENGPANRDVVYEIRNRQERIVAETLNKPSLDEIIGIITEHDFVLSEKRKALAELKAIDISSFSAQEKADYERDLVELELALAYIIPEDTLGFITEWALGGDVSDIKKITRDALLEAAILAEYGKDNPSDHLPGVFTDRDRKDIDSGAWRVLQEYKELKKTETSTMNWINGGK